MNTILDLFIHALIINQKLICPTHKEVHEYNSESWWRDNIFPIMNSRDKDFDSELRLKRESMYHEFIQVSEGEFLFLCINHVKNFTISFEEKNVDHVLNLPSIGSENIEMYFKDDDQRRQYQTIAEVYMTSHTLLEQKGTFKKEEVQKFNAIILVCILFLTLISLHPACLRGQLTRKKKNQISEYGMQLLELFKFREIPEIDYKQTSVKIEMILKLLDSIEKEDSSAQIIIFSSFRSFLDILYYHLAKRWKSSDRGKNISRYWSGNDGTRTIKKSEELDKFISGKTKVFLSVFSTGGLGLNLTVATRMITCEPPYTHATWIQAVKRMHR